MIERPPGRTDLSASLTAGGATEPPLAGLQPARPMAMGRISFAGGYDSAPRPIRPVGVEMSGTFTHPSRCGGGQ